MLTRIRKWRQLDKVVNKRGWEELLDDMLDSADRFQELIAQIPSGADRVKIARFMAIRDMVAHIIDLNFAVGAIIEALSEGKSVTFSDEAMYRGAGKRSWAELLSEHSDSRDWLEEVATEPVSSLRKRAHHLYGPLSSREWMALIIGHYEYHTKQMNRIMESDRYKSAARLAEEGKRAASR